MKARTELKVADLVKECNLSFEDHWEFIEGALKALKKRLIEEALETERTELVCCSYRERGPFRKDYRNGYWKRWLLLKDGRLELKMRKAQEHGLRESDRATLRPAHAGSGRGTETSLSLRCIDKKDGRGPSPPSRRGGQRPDGLEDREKPG